MPEIPEPIPSAGGSVASRNVLERVAPLRWAFREAPSDPVDNGWRFLSAIDDDDYINEPANLVVVDFNSVVAVEPAVLAIFDAPTGSDFELVTGPDGTRRFIDGRTGDVIMGSEAPSPPPAP